MTLQVQLQLVTPPSYIRTLIGVSAAPLPTHLLTNAPKQVEEDGPSVQAPIPHVGDPDRISGS